MEEYLRRKNNELQQERGEAYISLHRAIKKRSEEKKSLVLQIVEELIARKIREVLMVETTVPEDVKEQVNLLIKQAKEKILEMIMKKVRTRDEDKKDKLQEDIDSFAQVIADLEDMMERTPITEADVQAHDDQFD